LDQAGVQVKMFPTKGSYDVDGKSYPGQVLAKVYCHPLYDGYRLGKVSEDKLVAEFIKDSGIELSVAAFKELFRKEVYVVPGMLALVSELKKSYSLASLVNEGQEWARNKFDVSGFGKLFDQIFISGEIGLRKPEEDFYSFVLDKINAEPDECLFIDDYIVNCEGAEKLGIHTVCFRSAYQLERKLNEIGAL